MGIAKTQVLFIPRAHSNARTSVTPAKNDKRLQFLHLRLSHRLIVLTRIAFVSSRFCPRDLRGLS